MKPKFGMQQALAIVGFMVLCALTFICNDANARGVLIGTSASAIGFYTGASSPIKEERK